MNFGPELSQWFKSAFETTNICEGKGGLPWEYLGAVHKRDSGSLIRIYWTSQFDGRIFVKRHCSILGRHRPPFIILK
jgi:hypothetical protein